MRIDETIVNLEQMLDDLLEIKKQLKGAVAPEHSKYCGCCETVSWSQEAKALHQIGKQVSAARNQIFKVLEFLETSLREPDDRESPCMVVNSDPWELKGQPTFKLQKDYLSQKLAGNWQTEKKIKNRRSQAKEQA